MAWIESHQKLERHPKTLKLLALVKDLDHRRDPLDTVLGRLHRFWWWCLEYAEDGDLRKYSIAQLSGLINFDAQALIDSEWIDTTPYLRIHDWWDYIGRFLKVKYKNYPHKWRKVEKLYKTTPKGYPKTSLRSENDTPKPILPNLTKPNLTKPKDKEEKAVAVATSPQADFVSNFGKTYEAMTKQPFKTGKEDFVIMARLLKEYGQEATVSKAQILGRLCEGRLAWFTKGGWADYTLKTLSAHWNSILADVKMTPDQEFQEEMRKVKEQNERVNRSLNR